MKFDPVYIIYQIIALQCFYYLSMGTIWGIFHVIFDTPVSLDHFFTADYVTFGTINGALEAMCMLFCSFAGAYLISMIVERSKQCVDFTFTLYIIHVVICTIYSEFPLVWEWWVMQVISSVIMATVSEYICSRNELEDIPLYSSGNDQS